MKEKFEDEPPFQVPLEQLRQGLPVPALLSQTAYGRELVCDNVMRSFMACCTSPAGGDCQGYVQCGCNTENFVKGVMPAASRILTRSLP